MKYTVKPGDTMSGVVSRENMNICEYLAACNGKSDPNSLYVGETIRLPWRRTPRMEQAYAKVSSVAFVQHEDQRWKYEAVLEVMGLDGGQVQVSGPAGGGCLALNKAVMLCPYRAGQVHGVELPYGALHQEAAAPEKSLLAKVIGWIIP
jgi:hypothetical protein